MNLLQDFFRAIRWQNLVAILISEILFDFKIHNSSITFKSMLIYFIPLLVAAFGNLHNDIMDRQLDVFCKKKALNSFVENSSLAFWISVLMASLAAILSFSICRMDLCHINYFLVTIGALLGIFMYNLWLKKCFFFGNIMISILCVLSAVFPLFDSNSNSMVKSAFYIQSVHNSMFLFVIISIFILTLLRELVKDVEDKACDQEYGFYTLPIVLGINGTYFVCFILVFLYLFYTLNLCIFGHLYIAFLLIPLLIGLIYYLYQRNFKKSSQILKGLLFFGIILILTL